ncbi:MAG TPA: M23 family metallopeptidase [Vicinamibacterales bacterium]|nr:M23 family metallopeptidase [Vicinamibacterales bacterium]
MKLLSLALVLSATAAIAQRPAAPVASITIAANARTKQPGELVVLTLTMPASLGTPRVKAFDHAALPFQIDPTSWRVLVGIDLDTAPGTYAVSVDAGPSSAAVHKTYSLVVAPKKFATRKLTVDENFVNPPASMQERISRESARLAELWQHSTPAKLWNGPFVRPVPQEANSAFGTRSIFNGQPRSAHSGADFLSPAGTPIKAPNAGEVVLAEELYYSGNTVIIDHGLGLYSLFAHLSVIDVRKGVAVATGDVVGKVGATGRVTGPHLHWMVRVGGARVDPLAVLELLK